MQEGVGEKEGAEVFSPALLDDARVEGSVHVNWSLLGTTLKSDQRQIGHFSKVTNLTLPILHVDLRVGHLVN